MRCRKCGESIIVMKDPGILPGPPPPDNLFDLRSKLKQPDHGTIREESLPFAPQGPEEQSPQVPPESAVRPPSGEAPPGTAPEAVGPTGPEREPEAPAAWEMPAEEPAGPTERPEEPMPEAPEEEMPEARDAVVSAPERFVDADPADSGERKDPSDEAERFAHEKFTRWEEPPSSEEKPFELLLNDSGSLDFLKEEHPRAESGELDISGTLRSDPSPDPEPGEAPSPFSSRQFPREDEPMPDRLEAIQRELQEIGGGSPERMEAASLSPAAVSPVPPVRQALPPLREAGGSRGKIRSGRPSLVPLAILFLLIAGGGAFLGFTPRGQEILRRTIPAMESLWLGRENAGARFSMENLIGYYEPDAKAGTLYVIKGTITNRGSQKRSGVRVMAELFGSNRMYLGSQVVFAGNVLSGDALRTYSREAIGKEMANRWGNKLSNLDIAPGKSVPFMVVFFDAPEGIEEYRLEAWDGG